ncbi:MAG: hypothetical protein H0T66_19580 [Geodermatophilaceae bacterium]|nr:hypothetical protein [Geodermatophilaceae bacterium]
MLQLPPLAGLDAVADGASVYADDEQPDLYYVVPAIPRIRRSGPDARPALSFVKYRTTPADPDAAGGFLDLQTELVLADATRVALTAELARRVGRPVRLQDPLYVDGTVELITFRSGEMVEAIHGSSHPSLETGLVASFSVTLARDGAALLWTQLRTTPTPVAVRYAMGVLARFPPATVHVVRGPAGVTVDVLDWPDSDPAMAAMRERLVEWASRQLEGRTDAELLLTARSAVVWPVVPQATMAGLDGETRGFVEADLSDPWFELIHVDVRLNATLAPDRIAAVTVRLHYGEHRHDTVFTDPSLVDTFDAVVDPALGRTYRYQVEVQFSGTSAKLVLPEVESDSPLLLVSLDDIGWVRREVSAHNVDWDTVSSVQVGLRYADAAAGVPAQDDVVALDRTTPARTYERAIYAAVTQPVLHRITYVLSSGQRIEGGWVEHRGRLLLVPDVYARDLGVRFTAPGGFAAVAAHVVAVEHLGAGGRTTRQSFALSPSSPTATWALGLLAGDPGSYRYQVTTSAADGSSTVGQWVDGAGAATIAVGPLPGVLLRVEVSADLLDFTAVRLTTVSFTADGVDPGHLVFLPGRPKTQSWQTYLGQGVPALYSWTADYHLADGTRRSRSGGPSGDPALVLPPPPA